MSKYNNYVSSVSMYGYSVTSLEGSVGFKLGNATLSIKADEQFVSGLRQLCQELHERHLAATVVGLQEVQFTNAITYEDKAKAVELAPADIMDDEIPY